jgi:hypothetical protein
LAIKICPFWRRIAAVTFEEVIIYLSREAKEIERVPK